MARVSKADREAAVNAASEAARTLAQRGQEVRAEKSQTVEPSGELPEPKEKPRDVGLVGKLLSARPSSQAMDEILAKRGEPQEEEVEPKEAEPKVEPGAKTAEEPKAEVTEPKAEESPKTTKQTVDGVEYEVPEAEIEEAGGAKAWRVAKAGENRLAKASAVLEEARKFQAEAVARAPKEPAKPSQTDAQFVAERMQKIRFGTDEEAASALLEIQARGQKPMPSQDAIVSQAKAQIAHDGAVSQFDKEFVDLVKNPILLQTVVALRANKLAALQKTGKPFPSDWSGFYRSIGNEVRSAFGRQSQPATTTDKTAGTPSQPSDKEARKASIVNLPAAAARAEGPKEEKPLTPEQQRKADIAELRRTPGRAA
jgi:hypothetical protein